LPPASRASTLDAPGESPAEQPPERRRYNARVSYNTHVMIAQDLLEILVCPACKQALEYRENPESLKCTQCHRVYAVKDNIPVMLVDEATIEP
jgi:uncharacterized protein YbaR (Trm112 family)